MPRDFGGPSSEEMGLDSQETQASSVEETENSLGKYSFSDRLRGSVEEQSQAMRDYAYEIQEEYNLEKLQDLADEIEGFADDLMDMREGKKEKIGPYKDWSDKDLQELEANVRGSHGAVDNRIWDLQEMEEDW